MGGDSLSDPHDSVCQYGQSLLLLDLFLCWALYPLQRSASQRVPALVTESCRCLPPPFSHYIVLLDSRSKPLQARAFPHRCSTVDSAVLTLGMDSTAPADTQPNPVETKKQMLPVFDSSKKKRCPVPEEYHHYPFFCEETVPVWPGRVTPPTRFKSALRWCRQDAHYSLNKEDVLRPEYPRQGNTGLLLKGRHLMEQFALCFVRRDRQQDGRNKDRSVRIVFKRLQIVKWGYGDSLFLLWRIFGFPFADKSRPPPSRACTPCLTRKKPRLQADLHAAEGGPGQRWQVALRDRRRDQHLRGWDSSAPTRGEAVLRVLLDHRRPRARPGVPLRGKNRWLLPPVD